MKLFKWLLTLDRRPIDNALKLSISKITANCAKSIITSTDV